MPGDGEGCMLGVCMPGGLVCPGVCVPRGAACMSREGVPAGGVCVRAMHAYPVDRQTPVKR